MVLENLREQSYDTDIAPFLRNGIVIDSCVIFELIDGVIATKFSGASLDMLSDYQQILALFDVIKIKNQWERLSITPHVLTEVCRHLHISYRKRYDYKDIVKELFPMFELMGEMSASKSDFLKKIDMSNPVIEAGDLSIFVTSENFAEKKEKVAVITKDGGIKTRYLSAPYVLVIDYKSVALNYL